MSRPRARTHSSPHDPLSAAIAPPPDESDEARQERLAAEAAAQQISEQIDQQIERDRQALKKAPKSVKLLLLGQSESGKSTTLKNFQLMASPKAFKHERAIWRAVIQLNVVRSIHLILAFIGEVQAASQTHSPPFRPSGLPEISSPPVEPASPKLTPELLRLRIRLSPLVQVEEALVRRLQLSSGQENAVTARVNENSGLPRELAVHSASGWKGNFVARMLSKRSSSDDDDDEEGGINWDDPDDPGRVIHACRDDMIYLWQDPLVKQLLETRGFRLQEMSGFFLDSLDRVASERFVPTDDEILRARIRTLGIAEYKFQLDTTGNVLERQWVVYDVGGHTSLRAKWAQYFEDVNAIIFLAPISCFDQTLEEDVNMNRIEDSVNLWKTIVSNKLLAKTNIILFLNKCDILKQKLEAGVSFGRYITSYGSRPNTFEGTSTYMRRKFQQIFVENSPEKRPFYCNFTSVTDPKSTSLLLRDVTEIVLREHLNKSALV